MFIEAKAKRILDCLVMIGGFHLKAHDERDPIHSSGDAAVDNLPCVSISIVYPVFEAAPSLEG